MPGYRADVGIVGDRIAHLGRISDIGREEVDAEGHIVTPGFIDAHTHMDAQVFWDPLGTCSSWHGVTTVVTGNCGFTLAPARFGQEKLVLANLERAEDIPAAVLEAGIEWTWETFPQFMDAVDGQPKALNYAVQVGHSALRTFTMGERAFSEPATPDDLAEMGNALRDALEYGAIGFSTSTSDHHMTSSGRPVASRLSSWDEITALVEVVGRSGAGVFQLATDTESTESDDPEAARRVYARLLNLSVATGVPVTFGLRHTHLDLQLEMLDQTARDGGRMVGQTRSEAPSFIYCWKTRLPFDGLPVWTEFRRLPFDEQEGLLAGAEHRARLVTAADAAERKQPGLIPYHEIWVLSEGRASRTVADLAQAGNTSPAAVMIDLARQTHMEQLFGQELLWGEEDLLKAMHHPWTVMTFSDAGAHVSMICGASLPTTLLARWVRERQAFSLEDAVRMLTLVPALVWRIPERGLLREGMVADINVIDPWAVSSRLPTIEFDLPSGAPRVCQRATGYLATVVGGEVSFRSGEATGARPGRLLRPRRITKRPSGR